MWNILILYSHVRYTFGYGYLLNFINFLRDSISYRSGSLVGRSEDARVGSGLESYDATFGIFNPQIGRFWQIDPLTDLNENSSPYSFVGNNPIKYSDPSGLDTAWKLLETVVFTYTRPKTPHVDVDVDLAQIGTCVPLQHDLFLWKVDQT